MTTLMRPHRSVAKVDFCQCHASKLSVKAEVNFFFLNPDETRREKSLNILRHTMHVWILPRGNMMCALMQHTAQKEK